MKRTTVKLFREANPLTVIEEKLEGDFEVMMRDGKRDWMLGALREWERISGDKLFSTDNDANVTKGQLREAWSHFGQAYLAGKSRKGDAGALGGSNFRSAVAKAMKSPLGAAMGGYTKFFKAVFRRAARINKARREGKLDAELEAVLDRSLGFGEDARQARDTLEESRRIAEEIDEDIGMEGETFPLDGPPIRELSGNEIQRNDGEGFISAGKRWLSENAEKIANLARSGIGRVAFSPSSIKNTFGHGKNDLKLAALDAVPDVIENGVLLESSMDDSGKPIRNWILAAPVSIAGERHILAVRLRAAVHPKKGTRDDARFYVHQIYLESDVKRPSPGTGAASKTEVGQSGSRGDGRIKTLIRDAYNVKGKDSDPGFSIITDIDERFNRLWSPFHRNPEKRLEAARKIKERLDKAMRDFKPILRANRTAKDIRIYLWVPAGVAERGADTRRALDARCKCSA